jgi:hypothetical protein
VGLFHNNGEKERLFFIFYFFVGMSLLIVFTFLSIAHAINGTKWPITIELGNTIFDLAEFFAFYKFFKKCLKSKRYYKAITASLICFSLVVGIFFIGLMCFSYPSENIQKYSLFINVFELFLIFCMCLAYYYDLFAGIPKVLHVPRPSFFITTSTFFYSVLLIPFLILANDLMIIHGTFYHILFAVHFVLLIIVTVTILKVFYARSQLRPISVFTVSYFVNAN